MNTYAPCPQCRNSAAEKVSFTWWGGFLGAKLLTHVKCKACGKKYNGKTGKDNTTNIVIFSLVIALFCFSIPLLIVGISVLTMFMSN